MKIMRVADKYHPYKVWIIKRYDCGHYYVNQEIRGKVAFKSFCRISKRYLIDVLELF